MEPDENGNHPILTGDEEPELDLEDLILPTRAQLEERKNTKNEQADEPDETLKPLENSNNTDATEPDDTTGVATVTATVEDPGQYTPTDYSFEVTTYDDEGKNPKVKKINSSDDWDELLESEPNFGSAAAYDRASRRVTKMETSLEREKSAYDKAKDEYASDQAMVKAQNSWLDKRDKEANFLVKRGDLPAVAKKFQSANWDSDEAKKDPGVKAQLELLAYMDKENKERLKAGLDPMVSLIEAFNDMDRGNARKALSNQASKVADVRKQQLSRVGGVNSSPIGNIPKGVMVGRSFGSLDNLG